MTYKNAENQTYESRTEATGREYLFREVRGAAALPAGEGGAFATGSCRRTRNQRCFVLRAGKRGSNNTHGIPASPCRNASVKVNSGTLSRKINYLRNSLTTLLTFKQFLNTISSVNLMGGIPRIAKPASARPVKLTLNRQKQSGFCALTLTTKTKEVRA